MAEDSVWAKVAYAWVGKSAVCAKEASRWAEECSALAKPWLREWKPQFE